MCLVGDTLHTLIDICVAARTQGVDDTCYEDGTLLFLPVAPEGIHSCHTPSGTLHGITQAPDQTLPKAPVANQGAAFQARQVVWGKVQGTPLLACSGKCRCTSQSVLVCKERRGESITDASSEQSISDAFDASFCA